MWVMMDSGILWSGTGRQFDEIFYEKICSNQSIYLFSRAAEELTWERLLGLDGSLVFLEHVFWVVSLNTLFILVFAFCPYHIGHFTIMGFKVKSYINGAHFEGMSTTLCGEYI